MTSMRLPRWTIVYSRFELVVALLFAVDILISNYRESCVRDGRRPSPQLKTNDGSPCEHRFGNVAIVVVVDRQQPFRYEIDTLRSYSESHHYPLVVVTPGQDPVSDGQCRSVRSIFFRRHCVVAEHLRFYDWVLFIDADVTVVNSRRCVEEFIDDRVHVVHYERFFSAEVAAGSYLVKNSSFSRHYLKMWYQRDEEYADMTCVNNDNGILQVHLLRHGLDRQHRLSPEAAEHYEHRLRTGTFSFPYYRLAFELSSSFHKLASAHGKVKLLKPWRGWMRDGWITYMKWSEDDFILHGLVTTDLAEWACGWHSANRWTGRRKFFSLCPSLSSLQVTSKERTQLIKVSIRRMSFYNPSLYRERLHG